MRKGEMETLHCNQSGILVKATKVPLSPLSLVTVSAVVEPQEASCERKTSAEEEEEEEDDRAGVRFSFRRTSSFLSRVRRSVERIRSVSTADSEYSQPTMERRQRSSLSLFGVPRLIKRKLTCRDYFGITVICVTLLLLVVVELLMFFLGAESLRFCPAELRSYYQITAVIGFLLFSPIISFLVGHYQGERIGLIVGITLTAVTLGLDLYATIEFAKQPIVDASFLCNFTRALAPAFLCVLLLPLPFLVAWALMEQFKICNCSNFQRCSAFFGTAESSTDPTQDEEEI